MTIETKYSIGDAVYILYNNSIQKSTIKRIDISRNIANAFNFTYYFIANFSDRTFKESELFPTKEDAIATFVLRCKDL